MPENNQPQLSGESLDDIIKSSAGGCTPLNDKTLRELAECSEKSYDDVKTAHDNALEKANEENGVYGGPSIGPGL